MLEEKTKHHELQNTAIRWLYARGCSVFAQEVPTRNGIADALGVISRFGDEKVYYIEAKASRSDLICAKQKGVYKRSVSKCRKYCSVHELMSGKGYIQRYGEERVMAEIKECANCNAMPPVYDNNIDLYYLIVADGVKVEKELYPEWGVIDERGKVTRRAKKIERSEVFDHKHYFEAIAHVLVYKHFGKLYLP